MGRLKRTEWTEAPLPHPASTVDLVEASSGTGELALMRAVLLDAILCLRGQMGHEAERAKLAADAKRWVMSTSRKWPCSFESICDVLDVNASYLRRLLLRAAQIATEHRVDTLDELSTGDTLVNTLRSMRMRGNQTTRRLR